MSEKISVGDKVFLIHLEEEAQVTRVSHDVIYVKIDDMEIPVYVADIRRSIPKREVEEKIPSNSNTNQEKPQQQDQPKRSNSGLFLSFQPVTGLNSEINEFKISLVNDTSSTVVFEYSFSTMGEVDFRMNKIVHPYEVFLLHSIQYDVLNETPAIELVVKDVNAQFNGKLHKKIKPQNFFNKMSLMPLTGESAYIYPVEIAAAQRKEPKIKQEKRVEFDPDALKAMMMNSFSIDEMKVGSHESEVDLHIEALTKNHRSMSNSEMLHMQLARFNQALERAVAHGVDRLYVIHGHGSGKLRTEIHRILKNYSAVRSFNNDYNPKYGFGATEIIFK